MRQVILFLRLVLGFFILLKSYGLEAQLVVKNCKPPKSRELWHDRIDKEQRNALRAEGKAELVFHAGFNEDINYFITESLTRKVDDLQCKIELDSTIGAQKKVGYLRGIENLLRNFTSLYRSRQFTASHFPSALSVYQEAMGEDLKGNTIMPIIEKSNYDVAKLVMGSEAFSRNVGYKEAENVLIRKYAQLHPEKIFVLLKDNPNLPFRDSLIIFAAYKYPRLLYDFAAGSNRLGNAIRNINDSFIKAVTKMAMSSGSGQLYFPFLDNLIKGKQTFEEIDAVKEDGVKYYQLLVKTRMDYIHRSLGGENILEMKSLTDMLEKKAKEVFINTINGLHESPDALRFKILQGLNAQELYYLIVSGEDELYTSSYVKGVYPLMMQKINNRGDSLLVSIAFDRFKKFIKMAAGYNTLYNFISSIPKADEAHILMTAFVNGLEKSTGLEDGVDVADSYASIAESIKTVAADMLNNVKMNYDRNIGENNRRGIVMYNLLYKLFLSATDSSINLSREFGIPPVYNVSYQSLTNDTGKVFMEVFFYGDEDGKMNYSGFLNRLSNSTWKKVEDNKYWIVYSSVKGKPIIIYANKPLDAETGEIDKAQDGLNDYLSAKGIHPTIIVHRGHSYWAPTTIGYIQPSAKIVYLGSCGGYNLIHEVLQHSPDAHIIASKQTGKIAINQPFFNILMDKLHTGSNIDWIPFWKEFEKDAGKTAGFEDYIPPYKNLGAIFIKAYHSAMGEEGTDE
ncbi:MAG: hypothetical protein NVSMB67_06200 [Flavisolibacter sp.]